MKAPSDNKDIETSKTKTERNRNNRDQLSLIPCHTVAIYEFIRIAVGIGWHAYMLNPYMIHA